MDCSTPCLPVHHQLLEFAQTHVHQVGNAIQASHPLSSSPSPPAFSFSQHQGLFHWVSDASNNLILCHPLFLLSSVFPSIGAFSNELALHIRYPKYWSFRISPSNEYSGSCHNITFWDIKIIMINFLMPLNLNLPAMQETSVDPWVGKIPWRRKRLLTPVFRPGEFHGLYSCKESDTTEQLSLSLKCKG